MFSLKSFLQNHINKICSYVWSPTRSNTLNRKFVSVLDFRGLSHAQQTNKCQLTVESATAKTKRKVKATEDFIVDERTEDKDRTSTGYTSVKASRYLINASLNKQVNR